jgi:hypothetical protein
MPRQPYIPARIVTPTSTEFQISYKVYWLEYLDPAVALHGYEYALFVETHQNGTGNIFRIKGNVYDGMAYERLTDTDPYLRRNFSKMDLFGTVDCWKFPDFKEICAGVSPPVEQLDEPLYKSLDWCEDVIKVLKDRRVLNRLD